MSKDRTTFYQDYWTRTESQRIHGPMAQHSRRIIRRILEGLSYKSVLDVGCGEGTLIQDLFKDRSDLEVTGADISPLAISLAAQKNPGIRFIVSDLSEKALHERFDLVICSEVIEHIQDDEKAIRNLIEMTGRYLVITTLAGHMRAHEKTIGHFRNYNPSHLLSMITQAGLLPIRVTQWGWPFFSPFYRNLLEMYPQKTQEITTGHFGFTKRAFSLLLYMLFLMNSWHKGDQLSILAVRPEAIKKPTLPTISDEPSFSIIIPVRNEEAFMEQCIRSLKQLDYPQDKLEIIFADGRSTDGTAEIARSYGLRVVDNPGLKISAARNEGFYASSGEIIAFTDADCVFDSQWLKKASKYFHNHDIGGIGGPTPVPHDQNSFSHAVSIVFDIAGYAGSTVHFRNIKSVNEVRDIPGCNAFYRREVLESVMPTNTQLYSNEDVEMNEYICREGFTLLVTPDVQVFHYKRSDPKSFWKQMYTFAIGRLQLGKRDRSFLKLSHWIVGLGVPLGIVIFLILGFFQPKIWFTGLIVSVFIAMVVLGYYSSKISLRVAVNIIVALCVFFSAWPVGFIRELFFPIKNRKLK